MYGGYGNITIWMHLIPQSYNLKYITKVIYFKLCVVYHTKKKLEGKKTIANGEDKANI